MSEQPKYIFCSTTTKELNEQAQLGYRVHTIDFSFGTALMALKSDSKYENITNLIDVAPHEVDKYLAKGWIVTETWSKNVRMVKPSVQV